MTNKQPADNSQKQLIKYSESDIPKEFFILTAQEHIQTLETETPNTETMTHIIIAYQSDKRSILRDDNDLVCLVSASDVNNTITVSKETLTAHEKGQTINLHLNEADVFHICQQVLPQMFEQQKNYIVKTFPIWQTNK